MDEQYAYRTGRTDPIKSSRGLITFLLICVIFLGGLVSALSILNIHLFRMLQNTEDTPLTFSAGEAAQTVEESLSLAGMDLQDPDPVYQQLHKLPEGLYVVRVETGSQADKLKIQPGDVVTAVDKTPVSSLEDIKNLLQGKHQLTLWRAGQKFSLTISK
ncbi:MAG: PDZ domain-containing protein [Oscillospiraceae bacterium]|nr:PDZ domain-containing protein [Oscillospiraceae bacterium]